MNYFLAEMAWRFLIREQINRLPLDPFEIADRNGWQIYSYDEFGTLVHRSVENLIHVYEQDGFAFWSHKRKRFIIVYNSRLPFPVCRWTLAHEIGHIFLNHITPQKTVLSRVRTDIDTRTLLEREAQGFAQRILCPSIVLHDCNVSEPEEIMLLCGISREAAEHRSEYIKRLESRNKFLVNPLEKQVQQQFNYFSQQYRLNRLKKIAELTQYEFAQEFCA